MSHDPLASVGPELARMNRMIIAERLGWPAGAVEECEKLDDASPGWSITWEAGCYCATRVGWRHGDEVPRWLYGETVDELATAIEQHPLPERGPRKFRPLDLPPRD